jgi:glycosyltransferase involved in cell wall biosynthesis
MIEQRDRQKAPAIPPLRRLWRWLYWLLRPNLGRLRQHRPRPLAVPPAYADTRASPSAPRVSVVVPSFNQGRFLRATLDSVLAQQYPHLELIVQDGGSTDESAAILKEYSGRLAHWESARDSGQAQAINLGFRHATGDILAYLNSDDLLLPGALAFVGDFFARNPDVDAVYGHRVVIDESGMEIGRWILPEHKDEILKWADFVPQETLFWRRRIWERAGASVDERFRFAVDWDLLLRFLGQGARFERLPRFLGAFRVHEAQKTSAQMAEIGVKEIQALRERTLGRTASLWEIQHATLNYLVRGAVLNRLYRMRLIRY